MLTPHLELAAQYGVVRGPCEQLRQTQQRDPDLAAVEAALLEEKVAVQGPALVNSVGRNRHASGCRRAGRASGIETETVAGASDSRATAHETGNKGRVKASESALGYRSALLAMAGVAYPRMDEDAVDSLVLQQLLSWARELQVAMPAADDDDFTSLCAARCSQAHLQFLGDATVDACVAPPEGQGHDVDSGPRQAFAAMGGHGSTSDRRSQRDYLQRERPTSHQDGRFGLIIERLGARTRTMV
ncbi:unnamed protein product [Lampetra fluviatilis]